MPLFAYWPCAASRNINDWWLSYWIAHAHNDSEAGLNISSEELVSILFHQASISKSNTSIPIVSLEWASDNLAFYLGIYGGLAAANTVSSSMS